MTMSHASSNSIAGYAGDIHGQSARDSRLATARLSPAAGPKPYLYLFVFAAWFVCLWWFHPRLASLLDLAQTPFAWGALAFFIAFTELAWLYAFFNVGVILFASIYRARHAAAYQVAAELPAAPPPVAILYTTCNDFVEASVRSCVAQDYPHFTVYILDDGTDPAMRCRIDGFAQKYPTRVRVVRRADRRGFKAGNLNHALTHVAIHEPLFALADADEILPRDFLRRLVPRLLRDKRCGFVQANHQANPNAKGSLAASMGPGIDIHWHWYHPLRNRYGFVMLLGHGAVLRRRAWQDIGGFPELVSEDLAFALRIRDHGWRGHFADDVICFEDFPEDVRAFRIRHMKWTRGTCEFLAREMFRAIRSPRIPLVEKLDVLLPTLNLPLSLFYFLFVVDANLVLTSLFSHPRPLTLAWGGMEVVVPTLGLHAGFNAVNGVDFYLITVLTLLSPILCFVIEMWRTPIKLFRFLCQSTALYGALGPLSCLGVVLYLATGKAVFHVTADRSSRNAAPVGKLNGFRAQWRQLLAGSHPDHWLVQGFEVLCGIVFGFICLKLFQVSFLGLALAFLFLPILHHVAWNHPVMRRLVYLPFILVLAGLSLGGTALFGMQTMMFGFGFHF
jgi:cellulose synthase/poly-beta-1,6-N-acetylglucosamine synthase-like glycosyltransferase